MEELVQKWDEIKESIKQVLEMFDNTYDVWLRPLKIVSIEGDDCTISAPNYIKEEGVDFIKTKYGKIFDTYIQAVTGHDYNIHFVLEEGENDGSSSAGVSTYYNSTKESGSESKKITYDNIEREKRIKISTERAHLNSKYTFENFIVGGSNELARSAAMAVSENPGTNFNPLFIWGGPGLGKTHLMHAIGHEVIKRNPDTNVVYITSENFTNEMIKSISLGKSSNSSQAMSLFREKYRNIDLLLFDDVQFLEGKGGSQLEFFHTFNELHTMGKAIILSSDKPPKSLEYLEERIRSRFEWGITVDIGAPDFETRVAILRKNAELRNFFDIDDEIIKYIATKIRSNIRELEGALSNLQLKSMKKGSKKMTMEDVDDAIKDLITPDEVKQITIDLIIEKVCSYSNITRDDILSQKRNKDIAYQRQIIMYLCKIMTNYNQSAIGKALGNRDHSTVIYGINKIESDLKNDSSLSETLDKIKNMIING